MSAQVLMTPTQKSKFNVSGAGPISAMAGSAIKYESKMGKRSGSMNAPFLLDPIEEAKSFNNRSGSMSLKDATRGVHKAFKPLTNNSAQFHTMNASQGAHRPDLAVGERNAE